MNNNLFLVLPKEIPKVTVIKRKPYTHSSEKIPNSKFAIDRNKESIKREIVLQYYYNQYLMPANRKSKLLFQIIPPNYCQIIIIAYTGN